MSDKESIQEKTVNEQNFMRNIMKHAIEQFENKNLAYGDSFGKQFKKYGPISGLVRMSDKFNRFEALVTGTENKVSDESLEDTLVDLATYSLMFLYEIKRK